MDGWMDERMANCDCIYILHFDLHKLITFKDSKQLEYMGLE
jgi:hypothetical protein